MRKLFVMAIAASLAMVAVPGGADSGEGAASDSLTLSEGTEVDLDIQAFRVTKRTSIDRVKPVKITLTVKNTGTADEPRSATIVGMQNGSEVFRSSFDVSDSPGNGFNSYALEYTPVASGDIMWIVVIDDDNPDDDTATAVTQVVMRSR